jgi:hypothetical protein
MSMPEKNNGEQMNDQVKWAEIEFIGYPSTWEELMIVTNNGLYPW